MKKRLSSSPILTPTSPHPINQQLTRREDPGGNGEVSCQCKIKTQAQVSQQTQTLALQIRNDTI